MYRWIALCSLFAIGLLGCQAKSAEVSAESTEASTAITTQDSACEGGTNGDDDFCSSDCLCDIGQGDCDSSSECADGLKCRFNVGAEYGFEDPELDICDCPADSENGGGSFCSEACPCEAGQGDCDDDSECAPGLRCFSDIGASFGLDPDDDVCAVCPPSDAVGTIEFCTPECPCDIGQGDCDDDEDCDSGLSCFSNVGTDFGFEDPDTDVCSDCPPASQVGGSSFCSEECPCETGEGDCDSDQDCAPGLTCLSNVGTEFGYDDPDLDVCSGCPPPSSAGGLDFCSPECPCESGLGDCDSDLDCATGLRCFNDIGADFGYPAEIDVCLQCAPDSEVGSFAFCTPDCPCESGEGDCDNDSECAPGLVCTFNVGADFGFEATTDVCLAPAS